MKTFFVVVTLAMLTACAQTAPVTTQKQAEYSQPVPDRVSTFKFHPSKGQPFYSNQ